MAKHKLSETRIRTLPAGIHSDGDGLFLRVRKEGSRQWFFIYKRSGKRTELGLGGYGQGTAPVSLALAREKAEAVRQRLARGDELSAKKTFADVMDDVITVKESGFRNEKHKAQWTMTLREYAKHLHKKPIADITRDDVVETLKPIWSTIPETADRLRMRIAAVMDHAKARGLYVGDNPADWRGGLKDLLPPRQRLTRGHHAALGYKEIPAAIKALRAAAGISARAVEFTCLTAARSGEVRGATFNEFDLEDGLWTIPPDRMKAGKEHRVPLTGRAIEIVKAMGELATTDAVFPISDTAMVKALRKATGDDSTLHGLRSSFRDWCGDETTHSRDVAEAALAHTLKDKTEAAYRRSDALQKRRTLMEDWSKYCASGQ
ncbi:tyrosine-type recombinase/integrase [Mesorhizobium helmanticense]|uniref:Integrase n=1 Tax=Mesorhizobium helmanticense TaxID=1776423 RepID=A0A2T4IRU5_9HYPH|nr:site-specific integrase [Mesorhizobium helmanticense]PTE08374.1 integrase [Mesorhizobium helmanticense]